MFGEPVSLEERAATSNREFGVEDANPAEVESSEDVFQEELVDQASIQALIGASRRGVQVRVVYTGTGNLAAFAGSLTLNVSWQEHHHYSGDGAWR